jgi:hypothetical protein
VRKVLLSTLAIGLLFTGAARLYAEDLKPVVVISLPSYDNLSADLDFLGQVTDTPQLSAGLAMVSAQLNGGQGIKGLDKSKPIGAAVMMEAGQPLPNVILFAGTTDLKALLGSLPGVQANDKGDGTFEIMGPQGPVRVEQQNGWAVFTNAPELLKNMPADPSQLLGGLDKQFGAAVRVNVQNIPEQTREMFMGLIKSAASSTLRQQPGEEDSKFEMRQKSAEAAMKQLDEVAHDLDQFTFGFGIDRKAKTVHMDFSMTFLAGSKLAKSMADKSTGKSDFAGFLMPNAAVNFNMSQKLSPTDIEQFVEMLKSGREKVQAQIEKDPNLSDEATQKAAKQLVNELFDIGESAAKSGKMDGGGALVLDSKNLNFAMGFFLPDGSAVEKTFKKFVELGQADPNFPAVKFDVEKYKDVRFHSMAVPISDPQAQQILGDTLNVYLGVGDHSVYFAAGKTGIDLVKSVMDKSAVSTDSNLPPVQMNIALTPIVRFANSVKPGDPGISAVGQILSGTNGKDHVIINAKTIENGVSYRIEAEEGVLKVIGLAGKMGH